MFLQTESTPNPATLKIIPGCAVADGHGWDFRTFEEADGVSGLAARLLGISGVNGVFLGADFITVSKASGAWADLKPVVLGVIMEHFLSGAPVVDIERTPVEPARDDYTKEEQGIVDQIETLLETRVRPAVASDGGDVRFHLFRDGVVWLRLQGACEGCPSSTVTLKHGIENLLRYFIPDVREVRPVE